MRKSLSILLSITFLMIFAASSLNAHEHDGNSDQMSAIEPMDENSSSACDMPASPIIPDGNVASEDELVAASSGIKAYQANLMNYRQCLDKKQEALDPEAETAVAETLAIKTTYDASVDAESTVAEEFNGAVRAFKERQPAN